MKKHWMLVALVGLAAAACAPAEDAAPAMEEAPPEATIEMAMDALAEMRATYIAGVNAGDAAAVADLYTADAVYMPASGVRASGHEEIARALGATLAYNPTIDIMADATQVVGDWAVERGRYAMDMAPEGAEAVAQSGYWVSISQRQADGTWKLAWVLSNNDAESAIPSPADMAPAMTPTEMADDPLADLRDYWVTHYNLGHPDMVADLYVSDAVAMFANQPASEGTAAIAAALADAGTQQITVVPQATVQIGEWRADRGMYELQMSGPDGAPMTAMGHYIVVFRQDDSGAWKIHWHIGNVYTPAMG